MGDNKLIEVGSCQRWWRDDCTCRSCDGSTPRAATAREARSQLRDVIGDTPETRALARAGVRTVGTLLGLGPGGLMATPGIRYKRYDRLMRAMRDAGFSMWHTRPR